MDDFDHVLSLPTKMTETEYLAFKPFLEDSCGILLGEGKHYLVTSRLAKLMREQNIDSINELLTTVKQIQHSQLRNKVIDAMTTNETSWFSDGSPFKALEKEVFPALEERTSFSCKIWSAACSSGQEPYTISMLLNEYLSKKAHSYLTSTQITATDISTKVIAEAKQGIYEDTIIDRGLSNDRKQDYFTKVSDGWQVNDVIKRRINFQHQNLLDSFTTLGKFDVIFCRNVLIYFSPELKSDILNRMAKSLNPGGFLFLGASEKTQSYSEAFNMIRSASGVYFQLKD